MSIRSAHRGIILTRQNSPWAESLAITAMRNYAIAVEVFETMIINKYSALRRLPSYLLQATTSQYCTAHTNHGFESGYKMFYPGNTTYLIIESTSDSSNEFMISNAEHDCQFSPSTAYSHFHLTRHTARCGALDPVFIPSTYM